MKKFRPSSWQLQARDLGDSLYRRFVGYWDGNERKVIDFFALGYNFGGMGKQRRKYVERRAAKRVGRLINKYGVRED